MDASVLKLVNEIVHSISSSISVENLKQKLRTKNNNINFVPAIISIITGEVKTAPEVKKQVINAVSQDVIYNAIIKIVNGYGKNIKNKLNSNTRKSLYNAIASDNSQKSSIIKLILDIIGNAEKGALTKQTAKKTVDLVGPPPKNSDNIFNLILNALKRNETPEKAKKIHEEFSSKNSTNNNTRNFVYKFITNIFKIKVSPKVKMEPKPENGQPPRGPNGPQGPPNFVPVDLNSNGNPIIPPGGKPGYVLTTRKNQFGWWRNVQPKPRIFNPFIRAPPTGPQGPEGPPRNYTGKEIDDLLRALRNNPENRSLILEEIKKKLAVMRRNLRYESKGRRARKWGEFLRRAPRNLPGRRNVTTDVIENIRDSRNKRELDNFTSNLGRVPNENIRLAVSEQRRRLARKMSPNNEIEYGRRRRPNNDMYRRREILERRRVNLGSRYSGETNVNYARRKSEYNRNKQEANRQEIVMRRSTLLRRQAPPINIGERAAPVFTEPPPPLPATQQQAISNAGGVTRAVNTISQVPGGAVEVAKAAEALNETAGNVAQAVNVKGVSPVAVRAVQTLGGAKNAVNILEGLNTLSQTVATRKRKRSSRRSKIVRPRIAELNRVIDAVKKKKLISLVVHNVTKTHNIHPNDEKLKKYYKKILKSEILRTPFAKIVRRASKKK
jgi:hypothetical protein